MHYYGSIPLGSEKIRSWTIYDLIDDWIFRTTIKPGWQILGYLSFVGTIGLLMIWITYYRTPFPEIGIVTYITIQIVLLFVTIAIHEICHAGMIAYYGGRPVFGAKWLEKLGPVVYVTTRGFFTVHAYRRIAAAPLIMISAVCISGIFFGAGWWIIVPFAFNAIGAGGDLLSLRVLKRYPPDYVIKDTQDGFIAYRNPEYVNPNL